VVGRGGVFRKRLRSKLKSGELTRAIHYRDSNELKHSCWHYDHAARVHDAKQIAVSWMTDHAASAAHDDLATH